MVDEDLFYKLLKENPQTFKKSTIVNVRVIRVYKKYLAVKILDSGIMGSISSEDLGDKVTD
jgi:hypothetical protein